MEEGREEKLGTDIDGDHISIAVSNRLSQVVASGSERVDTKEEPDVTHGACDMPDDDPTSQSGQAQGDQLREENPTVEVDDIPVQDPTPPLPLGEHANAPFDVIFVYMHIEFLGMYIYLLLASSRLTET